MKIVFLSHTPRNSLFKVGSYHLSREFSRMGHGVLYVPSALSLFHFLNLPMLWDEDYRNTLKSRISTLKPVWDEDNVINLTPFVLMPFGKGFFDRSETPINQWFTFNKIDNKIRGLGFDQPDLVIQDKAGLFFMRKFIQARTWIYRATDDYSRMARGPGRESMKKLEQVICDFADRVVVTSRPLQQLFDDRYQVEATVIRNGVDVRHFSGHRAKPKEYQSIEKPIILYVGSMDQRFNWNLLTETARHSREWHYVLIGPGAEEHLFDNLPNVTALGSRPYQSIPAYMQHADVGILPLKKIEANHARSPMKIYEYGVSGLPVVSTPLRELIYRNEKFVTFAKHAQSFREQIRYCLANHQKMEKEAQNSSAKHSWNSIAHQILEMTKVNSEEVV